MKTLLLFVLILASLNSMAQKITDLPAATGQGTGGILPIVQGGITKKILTDSLIGDASATTSGKVNTVAQTFGGNKTFNGLFSILSGIQLNATIVNRTRSAIAAIPSGQDIFTHDAVGNFTFKDILGNTILASNGSDNSINAPYGFRGGFLTLGSAAGVAGNVVLSKVGNGTSSLYEHYGNGDFIYSDLSNQFFSFTGGVMKVRSLRTDGISPTQTGIIKMRTTDLNGIQGFQDIPTGAGGATDTAFIDFATGGALPANTVRFTKKNAAFKDLVINTPAALSAIRRVPGSLQVQGYIGGAWINQDFIDSIGAGGGGVTGFHGDTLLFTTVDGNLNSARTVLIANGEIVDIDVNYSAIKDSAGTALGAFAGRVNASAFKTVAGVLTVGGAQYPRMEVYYGTAAAASTNITNNGTGGININMVGQGGVTYRWKIWYTVKRHNL